MARNFAKGTLLVLLACGLIIFAVLTTTYTLGNQEESYLPKCLLESDSRQVDGNETLLQYTNQEAFTGKQQTIGFVIVIN